MMFSDFDDDFSFGILFFFYFFPTAQHFRHDHACVLYFTFSGRRGELDFPQFIETACVCV